MSNEEKQDDPCREIQKSSRAPSKKSIEKPMLMIKAKSYACLEKEINTEDPVNPSTKPDSPPPKEPNMGPQ